MNFKKIIAMTCSLALCAAVLTACGSDDSNAETTTSADTTISESISDTDAVSEDNVEEPAVSEGSDASDDSTSDDNAEDNTSSEDEEVSPNALQPLADAAMAVSEWPSMMEVTDEMVLSDYFGLDSANANYKNLLVLQCPMSAVMSELIIIEAEDVEAAKADLVARQAKAKEQAWYPNDVELAEASIVGTEGNYAYFILASAATEAEPVLVDAIKAL